MSIRRFLLHQYQDGSVKVLIELDHGKPHPPFGTIKSKLDTLLEGYPVNIEIVDSISTSVAGKNRWIISDMLAARAIRKQSDCGSAASPPS